jgi:hypothetical protein
VDEQGCSDFLVSERELSSFKLAIQVASSKVEVTEILHRHDLPEEDFSKVFPDLAKVIQGLPDDPLPPPEHLA